MAAQEEGIETGRREKSEKPPTLAGGGGVTHASRVPDPGGIGSRDAPTQHQERVSRQLLTSRFQAATLDLNCFAVCDFCTSFLLVVELYLMFPFPSSVLVPSYRKFAPGDWQPNNL